MVLGLLPVSGGRLETAPGLVRDRRHEPIGICDALGSPVGIVVGVTSDVAGPIGHGFQVSVGEGARVPWRPRFEIRDEPLAPRLQGREPWSNASSLRDNGGLA